MVNAEAFINALAGPGCAVEATVAGLADQWPPTPDRLAHALAIAGVDVDEWDAIELLIRISEHLAAEAHQAELFVDAEIALLDAHLGFRDDDRTGLVVDVELAARLPLLSLAADLATQTGGRLLVEAVESAQITGLAGCVSQTRVGGVILLDEGLTDEEMEITFPHELAHVADPDRATVDIHGFEAFAEDLGPRLLAHQPASLDEAQPLIRASLEAVAGRRRRRPASRSLEDLLEWALADVCPERIIELEMMAAHPRRART